MADRADCKLVWWSTGCLLRGALVQQFAPSLRLGVSGRGKRVSPRRWRLRLLEGKQVEALPQTLFSVGLLIVVAKIAEGITQQLRISSIVAYTAAGVLLGPLTGLVAVTEQLGVLVGIGVYLFFFLVGLDEIDVSVIATVVRTRLLIFALISIATPIAFSFLVTSDTVFDFGLGLSSRTALALATVLSLTSLGIAAKVLSDEGCLRDVLGVRILTTILIFKLLCLPLVGFMFDLQGEDLDPVTLLALFAKVGAFGLAAYAVSSRVVPPAVLALKRVLHVPHLSFGLLLGGLFLAVAGAKTLNLHGSVGALLFGASLSRLPHQVRRDVLPGMRSMADGLFVPLFFASGGLQVSFAVSELPLSAIAALALVPLAGKFVGPLLGSVVTRLEDPIALSTGLIAKGITEIALLLVLVERGMIGNDLFSLLILIMFAYVVGSPPLISFTVRRTKARKDRETVDSLPASLVRFALEDINVAAILERPGKFAHPELSVRDFVERWVVPDQPEYVVAEDGNLTGLVSVSMLRYLPKEAWATTPLRRVVRKSPGSAWQDEQVEDVLHRMQELSVTALPVLDRKSGQLLGSVTSQEIHELIVSEGSARR